MWSILPKDLLVGREEELQVLEDLYEDALQATLADIRLEQKTEQQERQKQQQQFSDKSNGKSKRKQPKPIQEELHQLQQELYLEEEELTLEQQQQSLTVNGATFCYLQGEAGVGKTSLVRAFIQHHKVKRRGFFFSYKFNQFGGSSMTATPSAAPTTTATTGTRPMDAFVQILKQLALQTITFLNDTYNGNIHSSEWQHFLKQLQACETLRSVVEIVPVYGKFLLGLQSSDHKEDEKAKDAFFLMNEDKKVAQSTLDSLLPAIPAGLMGNVSKVLYPAIAHVLRETRKFSKTPIVLFVDDIQWMDPGSQGVLRYLVEDDVPVLMLVAFRDDDESLSSTFALESIIGNKLKSADVISALSAKNNRNTTIVGKTKVVGLKLSKFTEEHVSQLLSHLKLPPEDHKLVTQYLYETTQGNQFYLRFRLSVMAQTGALILQQEQDQRDHTHAFDDGYSWQLDRELISLGMQMISEDAVDYCVRVLQTSLEKDVVAVLFRIALLPQGRSVTEYATLLQDDPILTKMIQGNNGTTISQLVRNAVSVAVEKSILYRHGPPVSSTSSISNSFPGNPGTDPINNRDTNLLLCNNASAANLTITTDHHSVVSFAHDRLQQAAIQCVESHEEAAAIHFFLGKRRLLSVASDNDSDLQNQNGHGNGLLQHQSSMCSSPISTSVPDLAEGQQNDDHDDDSGQQILLDNEMSLSSQAPNHDRHQQDVEAFEILQHFYKAKHLVKGDRDLILRIGELAARASGYYVTAGSHEQFDAMLGFVRELLQDDSFVEGELGVASEHKASTSAIHRSAAMTAAMKQQLSSLQVKIMIAHHQIKFLMNDLKAANEIFSAVRERLSTPQEIRDAFFSRISLLVNNQHHADAIAAVGEALSQLQQNTVLVDQILPEGQPAGLVLEVTEKIKLLFSDHTDWNVEEVANSFPISNDEDHNFQVEIMISVVASCYLVRRFDLYLYIPALACMKVLEKGVTRSSGHAFSVLGFALVAMFGDNFGAEIAMIGRHLVDRFDNPTCVCRALVLSGMAVIYDQRYEHLALEQLHRSYVAGRTAHDILWACYGIFIFSLTLQFEGVPLNEAAESLDDLVAYAMSDGHQVLTQRGCRAVLHTVENLMTGKSESESPVFHYSIPDDDVCKMVPLIPFTHAAASIMLLYFEGKLKIAWQMIHEVFEKGLDQAAPGIPNLYTFHMYTVLVCHQILLVAKVSNDNNVGETYVLESSFPVTEEQLHQIRDSMSSSCDFLENRNKMATIFTAYARLAKGCVHDALESSPWKAVEEINAAIIFVEENRQNKHHDVVAISHLLLADIFRRKGIASSQHLHQCKAISCFKEWGADHIAQKLSKELSKEAGTYSSESVDDETVDIRGSVASSNMTPFESFGSVYSYSINTDSKYSYRKHGGNNLNFAAVLSAANKLSSFSSFEELVGNLSSELVKQATATRLLLFIRQSDSEELDLSGEYTIDGLSSADALRATKYSSSIVRITDLLKESVVIHSAQQESPYCFESYIQESKVQSLASMPIMYKNSVIGIVYLEHDLSKGVFTPNIMATMSLLAKNVSSSIVNARLLRDLSNRTVQLEQSHTFLAKALRVKDTILSNTSHELRSPLNGIIGLNEYLMMSDAKLDPEVQNCANATLAMARQLLSLVDDILDLSRIGQGKFQLHYEYVPLSPLVNEVFDTTKYSLTAATSLVNNVDTSIEIMVDPARTKQVLTNLISNAVKFTPFGSVTVTSEFLEDQSTILISVADTGIGIEPSHLDVIFEPFFQATNYETRLHQGAGLGLSITKQLVELHGGRIDVVSNVGVGTTFHVFLPISPKIQSGTGEVAAALSPSDYGNSELAKPMPEPKEALTVESNGPRERLAYPIPAEKSLPIQNGFGANQEGKVQLSSCAPEKIEKKNQSSTLSQPTPSSSSMTNHDFSPQDKHTRSDGSGNDAVNLTEKVQPLAREPSSLMKSYDDPESEKAPSFEKKGSTQASFVKNVATAPSESPQTEITDILHQEPLRVLAVDDTAVNLKVLSNFLRKAEMVVSTATNGQLLLEKIEGDQWTNYDVILLDWMMPVMDGITACRLLRQRIPGDLLPVIFLTAKTDSDAIHKGFEAGATDFATKPFNRQSILARTKWQGLAARRARARYVNSNPVAPFILTLDPFWKMHPATGQRKMFVICFTIHGSFDNTSCGLDGEQLLRHFSQPPQIDSDWLFHELCQNHLSFLTLATTKEKIRASLRMVLSRWAEAQMLSSPAILSTVDSKTRPVITIGLDFISVRAHLFGEQQSMTAAVQTCTDHVKSLSRQATKHEDIVMSDAAQSAMNQQKALCSSTSINEGE